jgi:hypothetical protein
MSKAASIPNVGSNTKHKKNTANTRKRTLNDTNVSDPETASQSHRGNPAEDPALAPDETTTSTNEPHDIFFSRLVAGSIVRSENHATQEMAHEPNDPNEPPVTVAAEANMETIQTMDDPINVADGPRVS